jgi:HD superfamily phosphohydrolase
MSSSSSASSSFVRMPCIGMVELTPLIKLFIDTPEHQRMSRIRMGTTSIVYPSLTTTRREHLITTMYFARTMANNINSKATHPVEERTVDLIALAAVCHDIGHVAFSHMLDDILVQRNFSDHEERSVKLLHFINKHRCNSALTDSELRDVSAMITGKLPDDTLLPTWCFRIVHNSRADLNDGTDVDVDRLAYLFSDSVHCDIQTFSPVYLLHLADVDEKTGDLVWFGEKASNELMNVSRVRDYSFTSIYRHPTSKKYEAAIEPLVLSVLDEEGFGFWFATSLDDEEDQTQPPRWIKLTDYYMDVKLRDMFPNEMTLIDSRVYDL